MTLAELRARWAERAAAAEAIQATAPVATLYRAVLAELDSLSGTPEAPRTAEPERALDAEQVAQRLSTSVRWVYQHAEALGGRRLSRRCLRFPEAAIVRYLERRR